MTRASHARAKIREKELADAKAENDALRDDVAAGRRRLHIKAVCRSQCVGTTASAWIIRPPPDWRAAATDGIISPLRERLITMQKQLEGTRSILMSSADRVALIDGQLSLIL